MPTADIDRVAVVVPATDEEELLRHAIDGIGAAARRIDLEVELVVVANGCSDRTAEIAADLGAHVVVEPHRNVGAARAIGAAWALRNGTAGLWIASTDADSVVPPRWLEAQVQCAGHGFDVFLGTVELPFVDTLRYRRWVDRYLADRVHVHGANLGVRATTYHAAGGFRPLFAHEDVDLVDRLRSVGALMAWESDVAVLTSTRTDPRAPEGVGADLADELPA